jgi:hypothetical protein
MKRCKTCAGVFPTSMFYKHPQRGTLFQSSCKSCHKVSSKLYYYRNKELGKKRKRRPGLYGVDSESLEKWIVEQTILQNNACAICRSPEEPNRVFSVDHDHLTGNLRGLLCNTCNLALGLFKDNPEFLKAAAKYLEESNNVAS